LFWWQRVVNIFSSNEKGKDTLVIETNGIGGQKKCTLIVETWCGPPVVVFVATGASAAVRVTGGPAAPLKNLITVRRAISERPADGVPSCLSLLRRPVIMNWMH